jgi:hypothetical protein
VIVGELSQPSVAVAKPVLPGKVLAVQAMVMLAGQVMMGATLSKATIVCVQLLLLPQPSEAIQVRMIPNPSWQEPPTITSLKVIVGVPVQLSVAVAVPVFPGKVLSVQFIVTFGGHVIAGAILSSTDIICKQVLELPQSSVATQVRFIFLS